MRAALSAPSKIAADYYCFQLLTGCRGVEIHGKQAPRLSADQGRGRRPRERQDRPQGHQNRSDHKLFLSTQALQIAKRHCCGRGQGEPLFTILDARKTMAWINTRAGTSVQGHGPRATFASIAEELVSVGVLRRMMNHATGDDVTLGHYVSKSEAQLRAGWQAVADFIDAAAGE